ncbi:hypothetical protein M3Y99_00963200 [Aphelenchoides fujianensis]|nr:hypothetical protein M3Y99_00963200 [Aphelenchoides fujianensis]
MVEELGSGSSGEEAEQPLLYDEFVTAKTPFDFNAEPDDPREATLQMRAGSFPFTLSNCLQKKTRMRAATTLRTNLIALDPKRLTLAFCQPIGENVRLRCVGRNQFRVMGKLSEDGETLAEWPPSASAPPASYQQRPQIEPWIDGSYVFTYNCQR